ncbi:uncharacterized protein L201_007826 [Kwoniella dendrophila CBS 6074]|uniref:Uncharacterized protein n=1 Tax=Kwoniella dendrophila CBS 6074 TaxID=1295534 RepID=A0AAX4K7Q9_9TREE
MSSITRSIETDSGCDTPEHFNSIDLIRLLGSKSQATGQGTHALTLIDEKTTQPVGFDDHMVLNDHLNTPFAFPVFPNKMAGDAPIYDETIHRITFSENPKDSVSEGMVNSQVRPWYNLPRLKGILTPNVTSTCSTTDPSSEQEGQLVDVEGHVTANLSFLTLDPEVKERVTETDIFKDFSSVMFTIEPMEPKGTLNYLQGKAPIESLNTVLDPKDENRTFSTAIGKPLHLVINVDHNSTHTQPVGWFGGTNRSCEMI